MSQTSFIDVGALAAQRSTQLSGRAPRPQADFGDAYQRAEVQARDADRYRDAASVTTARDPDPGPRDADATSDDDASARSQDTVASPDRRDDDPGAARDASATPDRTQPDRTSVARRDGDRPVKADADQTSTSDDAKAPAKPEAKADAKPDDKAAAKPDPADAAAATKATPTVADAQATLALMLATGAQLATPQPTADAAQTTQNGQAAGANGQVAATVTSPANAAAADALAKALAAAGGKDAKLDAATLAKAAKAAQAAQGQNAQATAQAAANAPAASGPAVPAALAQAANALGPIKVQVETGKVATNLTIQLLDNQVKTDTQGPTAPATTSDGAASIEMSPQVLDLLNTPDATKDQPDPNQDQPTDTSQLVQTLAPAHDAKHLEGAAPASKDAPAPAQQAHEVMQQVLDHAELVKTAHQNEVKLQLYPEHLGKMEIRVVSHEGVISAQLSADSHQVKSILEGQVAMLQRSFAEMGLKVDKVEVTLSSANLDFAGGGNAGSGFPQQGQPGQDQSTYGQPPRMGAGLGYEQWLGEPPTVEGYAAPEHDTAINYVA